ncbi:MAG: dihydrofolate reductase family protein, partial [Chloroflexi bacterium]|nr:dihydrofolate reductase family protein [Chloroflexota bacterium]
KIKQQPGKDIALFGSSTILSALMQMNLMDEYRIFVNPVVLGQGQSLFKDISGRHNLKLLESRAFRSGNVLLRYGPA